MAVSHLIMPFPDDADREYFACWLSGFSDGESYFSLAWKKRGFGCARYGIRLRSDDRQVLERIQSFFACGVMENNTTTASESRQNTKPSSHFVVDRIIDLKTVVVPHFERYPLQAKKQRDFAVWKKGVDLLYGLKIKRSKGMRPRGCGRKVWTDADRDAFKALVAKIKSERTYRENLIVVSGL